MNIGVRMQYVGRQRSLAWLWQGIYIVFMRFRAAVAIDLLHAMSMPDSTPDAQRQAMLDDARMLRRAVHANSSDEVDWLLYAAILANPAKRRYCLERALALNPDSELAKQKLASIPLIKMER